MDIVAALVDCRDLYVSCERVFIASLWNSLMVVLCPRRWVRDGHGGQSSNYVPYGDTGHQRGSSGRTDRW